MQKKKIVALATASIVASNMLPLTQLCAYADEISEQQIVQEVQNEGEKKQDISTYTTAVRTLMARIKVENSKYGSVVKSNDNTKLEDGDNSIGVKTYYDNYEVSGKGTIWNPYKYTGTISSQDEKVNLKVTAKSGYIATILPNEGIGIGNKYINYDATNLISSNATIGINPINTEKWGPGSLTEEVSADLNAGIGIKFSAKKDAQKITTEVTGNGSIIAPEELYYNNNEALIDINSTHTFKINPGHNQEISATLNGEALEISEDNTVTIGAGHLNVEFAEALETDKYNLNVKVGENGKINIENNDLSGQATIKLSKEYGTTLTAKPNDGYYTKEVKLDGVELSPNEDGTYTLPAGGDVEERSLEVIFAEKMDATIVVEELRVPYTGEEQELVYNVINEKKDVIYKGKAVFTKKNTIGQTIVYNPKEIGNHNFKATFTGNEKYNACTLEGTLEIYDNRKDVTIELANTSSVYNGQVQKPKANVLNENGQIVGQAEVTYDFKAEHVLTPAGKNVGKYDITAKFSGDKDYQAAELKGSFEITKCKPSVSVGSKSATYTGQPIKLDVKINPNCGYIGLYTGVNTKLTPIVYMDVNLGDDLISQKISELINSMEISNVGDLKALFENEALINLLKLANIDISDVTNALAYLPNDMALSFGAPVNAGAYVSTAVVLDKNAEVTVGVGTLLVTKAKRNIVFTEDSIAQGSKVKQGSEYKIEAVIEGTDEKVKIKYTGLTSKFKTYSSTEAPKERGVYVATVFVGSDSNYRADLAVRNFTITK